MHFDLNDIEMEFSRRAFVYALLGRAFSVEPDAELLGIIQSGHTQEILRSIAKSCPAAVDVLQAAVCDDLTHERLKSDYTHLFLGPGKLPAPLWESVYLTNSNILYSAETLAVREIYRSWEFSMEFFPHMAEDHVGVELSFMGASSRAAMALHGAGEEAEFARAVRMQRSFYSEHLGRWIGRFAKMMRGQKRAGAFYPSLAVLAAQFCEFDAQRIDALLFSLESVETD